MTRKRGRPEHGGAEFYWLAEVGADIPSEKALMMGVPEAKASELHRYAKKIFDTAEEGMAWCEEQR